MSVIITRRIGTLGYQNADAVAITGGTINGTSIGGVTPAAGAFTTLNVTGAAGLTIAGNTGVQIGTASGGVTPGNPQNAAVFVGGAGGALNMTTGVWAVGVGPFALGSLASSSESTAVGTWAARYMGLAGGSDAGAVMAVSAYGMGALVTAASGTDLDAFGNDTMRSLPGGLVNLTAFGASALKFGAPNTSVMVGASAGQGNSSSITITGTPTTGDVLRFTFQSAVINGGSTITVNYTVAAGDTTNAILATSFANAIAIAPLCADTSYRSTAACGAVVQNAGSNVISLRWIGTQSIGPVAPVTIAATVASGAATEVLTVADGTTGAVNIGIGTQALLGFQQTTATRQIAIGYNALPAVTSSSDVIAIGNQSGLVLTTGSRSVFIGTDTGKAVIGASDNIYIGNSAGSANVSGAQSVAIGTSAMGTATAGNSIVAVGYNAFASGATGGSSIAIGDSAGKNVTSGGNQTLVGHNSGQNLTSGANNTALGSQALKGTASSTAARNVAVGVSSMTLATSAADSISIGYNSGVAITSGINNIIIGSGAAASLQTGSDNILISTRGVDIVSAGANTFGIYGNNAAAIISATATNTSSPIVRIPGTLNYSKLVTAKTADYSLVAADSNGVFLNTGAAGTVNLNLPAAVVGLRYTAVVDAAHTVAFVANGTDKVAANATNSAAGGNVASNTPFNSITVVCTKAAQWVATASVGTWTVT